MNSNAKLEKLHAADREFRHLERVTAALQWDQETYLPSKGIEERAEQLALLEGIAHERLTAPETGNLLAETGSTSENPGGDSILPDYERGFLRVMRRHYDRAVKLPPDFVSDSARAEGLSQAAWAQARQKKDFSVFLPHLVKMIDIARKKAGYWGFGKSQPLYDGLLDIYEPGMGETAVNELFTGLRKRLSGLLHKIKKCPPADTSFLRQNFPVEQQVAFNKKLLDYIGFDLNRGRMDTSAHPFTTTLGSNDIRITTRYFANNLLSGLFSVIHEPGHAFYEMGFPPELHGTCLADGASMAMHESQSRFWENIIGRSLPFWEGLYPLLKDFFPGQLQNVNTEKFYRAVNEVKPSLIRVDADELSYGLHIIFRFEMERLLISGELNPEQVPAVWHEKTKEYLGIDNNELGMGNDECALQDIHWSMGSFGYFPSYLLGNLYSAQFTKKLTDDINGLDSMVAAGKFGPLKEWLQENIYNMGCRLEPSQLLQKITGESLQTEPFLNYLETKYRELYKLDI